MAVAQVRTSKRVRRGEILAAALRVFTDAGYHAATIEQIRDASGASVGSIYHHFGGKEGIAAAIHVDALADYQRAFLSVLDRGERAEATVRAVVSNHLRWIAANPRRARYLLAGRPDEVRRASDPELREMNRAVIERTQEWARREVEAGAIREMPTRILYAVLIGPCQEFARQWLHRRDRASLEAAEPALADAAWRAVRA